MKNNLTNIITKLRQELPYVQKEFDVDEIELFGSYLRQEQNSKSDLDLLVTFKITPGLIKFLKLENYLSDILKIKVDLVLKDSIKPVLRNQILNNTLLV
jgi:predicted nucleotidyltransferase